MSYRALWIIAFSIEAMLMAIAIMFIGSDASLSAGIAWSLTQMPSHAISNYVLAGHFTKTLFIILTFVLQGTFFGSVLSLFKWTKTKLNTVPVSREKEPGRPQGPTRGDGT